MLWLAEHRLGPLDALFVALSVVGYAGLVWIALAPLLALAARRAVLGTAVVTAACVWGADLIALALKAATARPRPFEALPQVEPVLGATVGSSFPSGHAATSFAGAVVLASLVPRLAVPLFVLAVAVAFSRVYLGVHYPSDALAGAALGSTFALTALAALALRRRTSGDPPRSGRAPPAD